MIWPHVLSLLPHSGQYFCVLFLHVLIFAYHLIIFQYYAVCFILCFQCQGLFSSSCPVDSRICSLSTVSRVFILLFFLISYIYLSISFSVAKYYGFLLYNSFHFYTVLAYETSIITSYDHVPRSLVIYCLGVFFGRFRTTFRVWLYSFSNSCLLLVLDRFHISAPYLKCGMIYIIQVCSIFQESTFCIFIIFDGCIFWIVLSKLFFGIFCVSIHCCMHISWFFRFLIIGDIFNKFIYKRKIEFD